jgi:drug/metabolite transporter (DMT)-like permease
MRDYPVWRESIEVYFGEGHGFAVYFYLLIILAPVEFLSLYVPSLDTQTWSGSASLFRVSSVTALLLLVYFALRVANQEFAPWRFRPLKHWRREEVQPLAAISRAQIYFLLAHIGMSVLLCAPFLVWAGAIARTPLFNMAVVFLLLPFYSLTYGVWGLATLVFWERRIETRQVFIRSFFVCLVILSALFYLPLNPVAFLLAFLSRQDLPPLVLFGGQWPGLYVHLIYHFFLGGAGYVLYRWALKREPMF